MEAKKHPAFEAKAGLVRATVWPNDGKDGVWYSVALSRRYKADDNSWKSSSSFGRRELADVVRATVLAEAWIKEHSTEEPREHSDEAADA